MKKIYERPFQYMYTVYIYEYFYVCEYFKASTCFKLFPGVCIYIYIYSLKITVPLDSNITSRNISQSNS
jgi:hypothetical protein